MQTIVHDAAFQWGGAERVLGELAAAAPTSPNVRLIAGDARALRHPELSADRVDIHYPALRSGHRFRAATPFLALQLPRSVPVQGQVTYSSYAVARWLPSREPRFIYNHAPMRQIWHGAGMYARGVRPQAVALRALGSWLRDVDRRATSPSDFVVAPSRRMADILARTLDVRVRDVIPPPVDTDLYSHPLRPEPDDYFVWIGRVVEPIKRVSLLLELFGANPGTKLRIIGDGRDRRRLQSHAPNNVEFFGWRTGEEKASIISGARALLLPSVEDFGLCAAEALALGVPVVVTPESGIADWAAESDAIEVVDPTVKSMSRALAASRIWGGARKPGTTQRSSLQVPFDNAFGIVGGASGWLS